MDIGLLWRTVRHLRAEQVWYRLWYMVKRRVYTAPSVPDAAIQAAHSFPALPQSGLPAYERYVPSTKTFAFLNISNSFPEKTDWNFAGYGKLWTYNLNYFEWLYDEGISVADRLQTIQQYVQAQATLKDGVEPYPISLRTISWIQFLSRNRVQDEAVTELLYKHCHWLAAFPEYQIGANHLLENAFALFFAAHYFNDAGFYDIASKLLKRELQEQILPDGGHYELSPMYHSIILHRLLDAILLSKHSGRFMDAGLAQLMERQAAAMLGWLQAFCFADGNYAMVGDAVPGIAPTPQHLLDYAATLGIAPGKKTLQECGYRKVTGNNWELLLDVGDIAPSYQPGHAHADTLSFCVQVDGKPLIVDTGISTYQKDERRQQERGTAAHNTICIEGENSSEVWSGFRVGRRAKVDILQEDDNQITAAHTGYRHLGITHERSLQWGPGKIIITDTLKNYNGQNALLYLHFYPDAHIVQEAEDRFTVNNTRIHLQGIDSCSIETYEYCAGYNLRLPAQRLAAKVSAHTVLTIEL